MELVPTELPEVIEIRPVRHGDDRGWFSEVYKSSVLADVGLDLDFIQDNESVSAKPGTLRGVHYQLPPFAQAKLVRVVSGAILDVAVDLRRSSPTFGHWVARTLAASAGNQLFVPEGFGHAFCTLEASTHVIYKVTSRYAPEAERAVRWDDPDIGIAWPADLHDPVVSAKDAAAPTLDAQPDLFE